jgi:hypothetical protein
MSVHLRRREFIAALGGAAAWPLGARAQRPAVPVIGFTGFADFDIGTCTTAAYRQPLAGGGLEAVIMGVAHAHASFMRLVRDCAAASTAHSLAI